MANTKKRTSSAVSKALKIASKSSSKTTKTAKNKRRKAGLLGQLTKDIKKDIKKVASWKLGKGQNYPQSNVWTEKADKEVVAKPVGYRWTDEGAKKAGKSVNSRPTASDVEKYSGKTFRIPRKPNPASEDGSYRYIYQEKRVDKSDLSQKKKFEEGGETLANGGQIDDRFKLVKSMGGYKIYYNTWTKDYAVKYGDRLAVAFADLKEAEQHIKEKASEYAKGGGVKVDYKDKLEDLVKDLSKKQYRELCFEYEIDEKDAEEMANFIGSLSQEEAKEVVQEINEGKFEGYSKGGGVGTNNLPNDINLNIQNYIMDEYYVYPREYDLYKNKDGKIEITPTNLEQWESEYGKDFISKIESDINNNYAKGGGLGGRKGKYSLDYFKMKQDELDEDGNTIVQYDEEDNLWYWEDYKNDIYRSKFKREIDAYDNLIDYLENNYAKGGEVENRGEYLTINADKNKMVIKLTKDGVEEVNNLKGSGKSDSDIMYELFEDITANSELIYHNDLGNSGFGLTSASGVTDGYFYNDNGEFDAVDESARLYYFNEYMIKSEIDELLKGQLVLSGSDNQYSKGGGVENDERLQILLKELGVSENYDDRAILNIENTKNIGKILGITTSAAYKYMRELESKGIAFKYGYKTRNGWEDPSHSTLNTNSLYWQIQIAKYAKGGSLKSKAKYIPNILVNEIEIEKNGKTIYVDGADTINGLYVKRKVKYADGGETMIMNGKSMAFKANYKPKKGVTQTVFISKDSDDSYSVYDTDEKQIMKLNESEFKKHQMSGELELVKVYSIDKTSLYEMNEKDAVNYFSDQLKSADVDIMFYHGDVLDVNKSGRAEFDEIVLSDFMTEDKFKKETGYDIQDFDQIVDIEGNELEELYAENTYNWSYLGKNDYVFRVYEDTMQDRVFLIVSPHLGGDPRGNYGKAYVKEYDDKDAAIYDFAEILSFTKGVYFEFKDGSTIRFFSQQHSDVHYFEPDGEKHEGMALTLEEYMSSKFKRWEGDEFLNDIIRDFDNEKDIYRKGGRLTDKYKYIPNIYVAAAEVERRGKTTEIDGADIYNGIYVKKGKYKI